MFGNLKGKLGDVADLKKYASPQVLSSLTGSRQRSIQHTPGNQTPDLSRHSRQPSDASLSGVAASVSYSKLLEQNEANSLKTDIESTDKLKRDLEKLKSTLELQQDTALQRLNVKEQEWRNKYDEQHKKIAFLEEELKNAKNREETINKNYSEKEKEILINNERILEKEAKLKDVEHKLVDLQEDYDQLEGLGTQEIAKVKHLLLNASSDLEKAKVDLEEKSHEIRSLEKRLLTFEGIDERLHRLSEEKMDLETSIAGLNQKLITATNRHLSVSEEHEEEVKHLKEKIAMLEERCSQDSSVDTERDQAFIKERESYERKLEETRQQLNNIKSSWSDKITSLEVQIQNLNEKIVEDQVDLKVFDDENAVLKMHIEELKNERKSLGDDHKKKLSCFSQEVECLKEDLMTSKWQLETESANRNQEIKELRRNLHVQEEKAKQLLEDLEIKKLENRELKESLKEIKLKNSELENKISSSESKCSYLQTSSNSLQENLNRERGRLEGLEQDYQLIKEKHDVVSLEKSKLSSNLDKYLEKVTDYEVVVKTLEEEKCSLNAKIQILITNIEDFESKNNELNKTVFELSTDFEAKIQSSDLVQELREKLKGSEDEVSEKKQMLKVQSQRIADMKKTIQRELKMNPEATDSFLDLSGLGYPSPKLSSDSGRRLSSGRSSHYEHKANEIQNGETDIDPINIEYLKHVILKFITSREYEAVQLTRAVSTLLHLTSEEENLLRETLEWKMSWFGSRPNIGKGQMAKAIPPSQ